MILTPEQIIERQKDLLTKRQLFEELWQDVADYVIPRKNEITVKFAPGQQRNTKVFDTTAIQAAELLASALHSLATNPATDWFKLTTGNIALDNDDEVRKWLQATSRKIRRILDNSNFQTQAHEFYLDLVTFGTGIFMTEEDENAIARFNTKFIAEMVIDENNLGLIDEVHRTFKWNSKKIIQEFGKENVGREVLKAHEEGMNTEFEIIHSVYALEKDDDFRFPIISQHVLTKDKTLLRESGFNEFPFAVTRFTKASNEMYGRSPAIKTLPDIRMINKMEETVIKSAQKVVDPPLQAPDDGFVLPIKTMPAGLNFFRAGTQDRIEPIFNNARIDFGFEVTDRTRQRIDRGFFIEQLELRRSGNMTATEVVARTEEQMRLLSPLMARLSNEWLRPTINRVIEIMLRRGIIDIESVPSKIRKRGEIDVKFSSLIARAQKNNDLQKLARTVELTAPIIQASPQSLDVVDSDQYVRTVARLQDVDETIIRDQKEVSRIRKQRAQAQQQALEAQQQDRQVENAVQLSQAAQQ